MNSKQGKKKDIETRITQRELLPVSTSTASSFFSFFSVLTDRFGFLKSANKDARFRQIRMQANNPETE